jgi:outer membrane autotransporter protein
MYFRKSLLLGTSVLALNASVSALTILVPDLAEASCVTLSSTATIVGPTSCVTWTGGNLTLTNNGTLSGTPTAITVNSHPGTLTNFGLISGTDYGVLNTGTVDSISNNTSITGGTVGIINGGIVAGGSHGSTATATITNLNNSGTISGIYGINNGGIVGGTSNTGTGGTIGTLTNSGVISGSAGINNGGIALVGAINAVSGAGSIGTLINSGTITGTQFGINNVGTIDTLTNNAGSILATNLSGQAITNGGSIGTITNNGGKIIASGSSGTGIGNSGTIGTITNSGTISGGTNAIFSSGTILGAVSNSGVIAGNINVGQDLTITGGSSSTLGTLTGFTGSGLIRANNLTFDNNAFQLLGDDIIANSGAGTVTNNGTLQLNTAQTITGNYTQASAGLLKIGVTNSTTYGSLNISGNVNMAGDHILITPIVGTLSSGETFTIVTDSGTANYSGITATVAGFNANISTANSGEDLIITLAALTSGGSNTYANIGQPAGGVAYTMGGVLDQISASGNPNFDSLFTAFNNQSPAGQKLALKQLAPNQMTPQLAATNALANQNMQVISQHQDVTQANNGAIGQAAGSAFQSGIFWGQITGGTALRETTGNTDGYRQNFYGLTVGADKAVGDDTTVGAALGWMHGDAMGADGLSGTDVNMDSVQLTGYGAHRFGPAFIDAMLGASYNMFNQSRYVGFLNDTANASYDGMQYMAHMDAGWNFPVDHTVFTPLVGLQYIRTDNDAYQEHNGGIADLSVGHQGSNSLTTLLGGEVKTSLATAWGTLIPQAKLEWAHDLTQGAISTPALLGGVNFSTQTERESPNGALITLAATLEESDNFSLRAEYNGDIRSDYIYNAGMLKASWKY